MWQNEVHVLVGNEEGLRGKGGQGGEGCYRSVGGSCNQCIGRQKASGVHGGRCDVLPGLSVV